jgi:hypothetical protein
VTTRFLLCGVLGFDRAQVTMGDILRLKAVMKRLGWVGPRTFRMGLKSPKGYKKPIRRIPTTLATPTANEQCQSLTKDTDQQHIPDDRQHSGRLMND